MAPDHTPPNDASRERARQKKQEKASAPVQQEKSRPPVQQEKPPAPAQQEKSRPPVQDEWGFFDPEQCGFSALLTKLDEISEDEKRSPKKPA